jgi:hypothetical protein
VNFVDDEDSVFSTSSCIRNAVAKIADIVDACVGGSVDLDHIHGIALNHFTAGRALVAGNFASIRALAAKGFGHDSRSTCFAYASRAREEIRVRTSVLENSIFECLAKGFLTNKIFKFLWAISP